MGTLILGFSIACISGAAAFGMWLEIQSTSIPLLTGVMGWAARAFGLDGTVAQSADAPLWLILGFVVALSICGAGLLIATLGTIWVTVRGARYAVQSPVAQGSIDRTLDISKQGIEATKQVSRIGYSQAQGLAERGVRGSKPHLNRAVGKVNSWRARREERKQLY